MRSLRLWAPVIVLLAWAVLLDVFGEALATPPGLVLLACAVAAHTREMRETFRRWFP